MLADMTAEDVQEWIEDYAIELWDEDRLAIQLAEIGASICCALGYKRTPKDFLPKPVEPERPPVKKRPSMVAKFLAAARVVSPRVKYGE